MSGCGQQRSRPVRPSLWLVTFGDLLTLLLCFFLATVSLRPLSGSAPPGITQGGASSLSKRSVSSSSPGTQLANSTGSQVAVTVAPPPEVLKSRSFNEASFRGNRTELNSEALRQINSLVNSDGYRVKTITVHSCVEKNRYADGKLASLSVERALAIRGQLIDIGAPAEAFRLRPLGPNCSALRAHEDSSRALLVEVLLARESHG